MQEAGWAARALAGTVRLGDGHSDCWSCQIRGLPALYSAALITLLSTVSSSEGFILVHQYISNAL
jgi:hypothetical protein